MCSEGALGFESSVLLEAPQELGRTILGRTVIPCMTCSFITSWIKNTSKPVVSN